MSTLLTMRERPRVALLGICHRTITIQRQVIFKGFRQNLPYPKNPNSLGEHLRKARLDRKVSTPQVAEFVGVDRSSVQRWEADDSIPADHHRAKIVSFLGIDPFTRSENPT